ncbi:MAG: Fic family protein [Desulfobacteraceae bacterium]|nr:Fic family protein [Desulfobacteraceae bacterium]
MTNKPKTFLTFKSGKFSFIHNFKKHKLYTDLAEIVILNETVVDLPILPKMASKLELEIHYRSIAGTAAIENNPLTETDVKNIAEGKDVEGYSQKHKQEIINLIEVYKKLSELKFTNPLIIDEQFIKSVHKDITQKVEHEYNNPGHYRNNEVFVGDSAHGGVYKPPKILKDIQDLMAEFVKWLNSEKILSLSPIVRAALAHYHLCLIHPFADGNGRTGRFLEAILLKSSGMTSALKELSNYYYRNIDDYYLGFSNSIKLQDKNDISPFLEVMLKGTKQSLREIKTKVIDVIRLLSVKDYFRFLFDERDISKRQYHFLQILINYKKFFVFKDLYNDPMLRVLYGKVSEQTARRDIKKLISLRLIMKEKDNNKYLLNLRCLG